MSEIHVIVDRLNDAPFNMSLSLASFDEKSPFELLEIVNLVMGHLSDVHRVDLRDETPEKTINRMTDFLRQLNFKTPVEPGLYQQALLQGDPAAIHPMLAWLLVRLPELRTRAYLASFLAPVEMPEALFGDEEVVELHEHLLSLQQAFKDQHKALEKLGQQIVSPAEIRRAIVQMEADREHLTAKSEALHARLRNVESFAELLDAVTSLRLEQDEQQRLAGRVREQRAQLSRVELAVRALSVAVRESQAVDLAGGGEQLLRQLQAEVERARQALEVALPRQIEERQTRLAELEGALADGPVSADALREARAQVAQRAALVRQLEGQRAKTHAAGEQLDDGLAMFRQQAALIGRKHEAVTARLAASASERDSLEQELVAKMARLEALAPAQLSAGLSNKADDFKKYASNLRGKTAHCKKLKAALAELRAEFTVLHRTEQLLQAQARSLGAKLSEHEGSRGVRGLSSVQQGLELASEAKAVADEAKQQTLEEISQLVEQTNEQIRLRKGSLAPQIKALRSLRASYQQLEADFLEKKGLYESTAAGLDSELSKLAEEVAAYEEEIGKEQSRFHYLHSLSALLDVSKARAQAEATGRGKIAAGYTARLRAQEEQTKELRAQQKAVKENVERNSGQLSLFKDLHRLLKCKLECQRRELELKDNSLLGGNGGANVFTMPDAGNHYTDIDGIEHS